MSRNHKIVCASFLAGFFISIALIVSFSGLVLFSESAREIQSQYYKKIRDSLPATWLAQGSKTEIEAKENQQFWTYFKSVSGTYRGFALKVLENPDLFQRVFPGYPLKMASDSEVWNSYFKRNFKGTVSVALPDSSDQLLLNIPLAGCVDIAKKYGADIVVVGASDAYTGILPSNLFEQLKRDDPKLKEPRILTCTNANLRAEAVRELGRVLKNEGIKSKWVVWNVNLRDLFLMDYTRTGEVQSHINEVYLKGPASKASFSISWHRSWDSIFQASMLRPFFLDWSPRDLDQDIASMSDRAQIEKKYEQAVKNQFSTDSSVQCDLVTAANRLTAGVETLKVSAQNLLVMASPHSWMGMQTVAGCNSQELQKLFSAIEGRGVHILAEGHSYYGLKKIDHYIRMMDTDGIGNIFVGHTNADGARLITEKLADKLVQLNKQQIQAQK